jgi:methylmalonyl-CoA/ethylmalonyl-CoA epimerase
MDSELLAVLDRPRLHHVGVVVKSEAAALQHLQRLGLEEDYRGHVPAWDVLCIFCKAQGGSAVELVVPLSDGPLRSFNNGLGGLHHLAFEVPSIEAAAAALAQRKLPLLLPQAVKGAGPFLCNFIPPLYTRAYAIELVQLLPAPA